MHLLDVKADIYRQELKANSLRKEALETRGRTKCRWAGHKQHQVVKSSQSRKSEGSVNIANTLKAQADLIYKEQYLPLVEEIQKKQRHRIAKGWGSKIPNKVQARLDEILKTMADLKRKAKDMTNEIADHHYITNQKFQKV